MQISTYRAEILCSNALMLSYVLYEISLESVEAYKFLTNLNSLILFTITLNFKNSMYPGSFLCEAPKIKQHIPSRKEPCDTCDEAI